jgi:hypothetical protein
MEKSMNVLIKLINDYNSLTRKLNESIRDKSFDPEIVINPEEIRAEMDRLRHGLITLEFIYMKGELEAEFEDTHFEEFVELNIEK